MKVALVFLSVMVAITHQQFQRQRERLWRNYYPSYPSVNNKYQRIYQNLPDDIQPEYFQFRPTRPVTYSEDDEFNPNSVTAEYRNYFEEDEYPDVHSRVKVYNQRLPLFPKRPQDQQQRFLISYVNNLLTKTLTLTSSLTLTSIQSCIAAAKFVDAAAKKTQCRRKRDLLDPNNPEDTQFAIVPTETQRMMPTALPSLDLIRQSRRADQSLHQDIITSSKDVRDVSESASWMRNLPAPRFLNSFSSTTLTTYSFKTEIVTKTVVIGGDAQILCLPSGWIIC